MNRFFHPLAVALSALLCILVAAVMFSNERIERQVQRATLDNFSAANMLTNIQISGERMRRYEKEMFIYAGVPDKRAKYVKDFDDAYSKLLDHLNAAQASQHKGFTAEDRTQLVKWVEAAAFYGNEFRRVATTAESTPAEQQAGLTLKLNADIGPGKDRFAVLLKGASEMREAKQKDSLEIGGAIQKNFVMLDWTLIGVALLGSLAAFAIAGRRAGQPRRTGAASATNSSQFAAASRARF